MYVYKNVGSKNKNKKWENENEVRIITFVAL